jgi:hypothetical protein
MLARVQHEYAQESWQTHSRINVKKQVLYYRCCCSKRCCISAPGSHVLVALCLLRQVLDQVLVREGTKPRHHELPVRKPFLAAAAAHCNPLLAVFRYCLLLLVLLSPTAKILMFVACHLRSPPHNVMQRLQGAVSSLLRSSLAQRCVLPVPWASTNCCSKRCRGTIIQDEHFPHVGRKPGKTHYYEAFNDHLKVISNPIACTSTGF